MLLFNRKRKSQDTDENLTLQENCSLPFDNYDQAIFSSNLYSYKYSCLVIELVNLVPRDFSFAWGTRLGACAGIIRKLTLCPMQSHTDQGVFLKGNLKFFVSGSSSLRRRNFKMQLFISTVRFSVHLNL